MSTLPLSRERRATTRRQIIALTLVTLLVLSLPGSSLLRLSSFSVALADASLQTLPFSQNWANNGLITTNDIWTGVPGVQGFLGQDLTTATGTDPQTILTGASGLAGDLTVLANQTSTAVTNGDVGEFHTTSQTGGPATDSTIALQGSGTADAPHIILYLNTTGQTGINVSYNLRDIDCTTDNSIQQVALQYRVGNSGNFTNLPAGYVADASAGPSLCTQVTPVSVALPVAAENQAEVQVRIMSTNAVGNDEWIGVDDISVGTGPTLPTLNINDVALAEGNAGTTTFTFQVSLTASGPSVVTFDIATADGTAQDDNPATEDNDYVANSEIGRTITSGNTSATFSVTVNGDTTTEPNETFFVNITNVTGANAGDVQGLGTINNDDVTLTAIHAIQGTGSTSPLAAQVVTTSGIVTGLRTNGFFVQEPDATVDADPNTSEGIFVFTSSAPPAAAALGNSVQVTGTVAEFIPSADPSSPPLTELTSPTVLQLSTGNPLPTPVVITAGETTLPSETSNPLDTLEEFEGMRVTVASLTAIAPTQGNITESSATANSNGVFYGVVTGVSRPFREPGISISDPLPTGAPGSIPRFDENPERLRVDSDGQVGATAINVTTGTVVTGITGVIDFGFRTYTILPDAATPPSVGSISTFTPVPNQTANELTVGSFNMQRFYNDVDDTGGDVVLTTTAFNNRLNKASLAIRNAMRSPDVIGIVEMENLATLQAVASKVNSDAVANMEPNPNYQAYLVEGNDIGLIDVGFLVKAARVSVVDVTQFGLTDTYINPNTGSPEILNDRPPLVLRATIAKPAGGTLAFTVIVNHLRSLNGVDDPTPSGSGTEGARVRAKRRAQAEYLANLIQARQTNDPTEKIISVGDYNAFQFNDGYVDSMGTITGVPTAAAEVVLASSDLVNPDLTNLISTVPTDQRYSFTFDGNAQSLDHVLVNDDALAILNRFAYARNNADFPQVYFGDANRPERISDHDMPVAYFSLGGIPVGSVVISEFRFRGPSVVPGQVDGSLDEYIELYNNTDAAITVNSVDGTSGWALSYLDSSGALQNIAAVIPNGTVIPARGHYLLTNEPPLAPPGPNGITPVGEYTLDSYANADQRYRAGAGLINISDDSAIAVFQTANISNFSLATRLDAVSLSSVAGATADLYREGTNLPSPGANDGQYAYVRKLVTGLPQDTNNNAADFVFVSTNGGSYGGVQSQLGAPGPENTLSPIQRNSTIKPGLIEPQNSSSAAPNRVRDLTPVTNGALGTLSVRRRFTNQTGAPITRLRFRVVDITTLNSPGYAPGGSQADVRVIDGSDFSITTSLGMLTVRGLMIEQPAPLVQPNGGGLNSSVTVTIPGGAIANGASIDVHFLLGVQQGGTFRAFFNVEGLP
ncbi:MAG TPA: hypothetical protein VFV61_04605 [Pyrinomonadaceae bacterium]|nr:hypothetical protein [Pyrinomonadaceae bacterium]